MRYASAFTGFLFCVLTFVPSAIASDHLNPELLRSVIRIETAPSSDGNFEIGSSFLASTTGDESGKVLLITNKHVIGDWNPVDQNIRTYHPWISVFFYRSGDPTGESYRATKITLLKPDGSLDTRVHLHPSPSIDVVAIDVTDQIHDNAEHIAFLGYGPAYFLPFNKIKDYQTDVGDEVFALGYPLGIRSLHNDYPLAKIGYVSSLPGEEVNIPFQTGNREHRLTNAAFKGKFLVVDGLIVPGNSGGPVVLVGGIQTRRDPKTNQLQFTDKPIPNSVIGIVSCSLGGGLTVVVSSDYILDVINTFK